jgi:HAMP domain-containing protein
MRISVKFKLLPIIVIGIALLTGIFYYTFTNAMEKNIQDEGQNAVGNAKELFYGIEANDVKMLSGTLEALLTNDELKTIYLKKNRTELYNYGYPIHKKLKDEFGMSHFYIHLPNGTNFIRMHSKNQFGDMITRKTFQKSVATNGFGSGLELGATAFALRVVHPYYNGTTLIGYIELGEEIGHFLKVMKNQTHEDFGLFINKQYITHKDWKAALDAQGLRDNYDDLKDYVAIDTTTQDISSFVAKDEGRLSNVPEEGVVFNKYEKDSSTYLSGGFPLYDAGGVAVGTVVVVMDVTNFEQATRQNSTFVLITAIIAAIAISLIVVLLVNKYILKPLDNIVESTTRVAGGDFTAEIKAQSNDEIGDLAVMIEGFKKILVGTAKDLEHAQEKK